MGVICMTGITLHVVRKATSVEARGSTERSAGRGSRRSPGQQESLLSQSESEDDSEVEVFHTTRSTRASSPQDEPFLREIRTGRYQIRILVAPSHQTCSWGAWTHR